MNSEEISAEENEGYEVGYKRPPTGTQFKKGQSGNPKGKPKTRKNPGDILAKELFESVDVRVGENISKKTRFEVVIKRVVEKSTKGEMPAIKCLWGLMEKLKIDQRPEFRSEEGEKLRQGFLSELSKDFEDGRRIEWKYIEISEAAGEDANEWMQKNFDKLKALGLISPAEGMVFAKNDFVAYSFLLKRSAQEQIKEQ